MLKMNYLDLWKLKIGQIFLINFYVKIIYKYKYEIYRTKRAR